MYVESLAASCRLHPFQVKTWRRPAVGRAEYKSNTVSNEEQLQKIRTKLELFQACDILDLFDLSLYLSLFHLSVHDVPREVELVRFLVLLGEEIFCFVDQICSLLDDDGTDVFVDPIVRVGHLGDDEV